MKELWVPVSASIAQQRKVESIANNIANANTAGFKKDTLVFKEELAALKRGISNGHVPQKEWSPGDFYHHHGAEQSFVGVDGSFTKHTQGPVSYTHLTLPTICSV